MRTPKELGAIIASLRHDKNLTQRALAERLHVTDKAVSRWERGLGYPDYQLLDKLCRTLDVPMEWLLQGEDHAQHEPEPASAAGAEQGTAQKESAAHEGTGAAQLAEAYSTARRDYRKKLQKKRLIAAAAVALILCAAALYFMPVQRRVSRTLTGEYTPLSGEAVPIRVEFDGYLLKYLFRWQGYSFYKGTLSIFPADGQEPMFSRRFTGKTSANGMDIPGMLEEVQDAYYASMFFYRPESNDFGIMQVWITRDFRKVWIPRLDDWPGEMAAACDPDVDLKKLRERFIHAVQIQP